MHPWDHNEIYLSLLPLFNIKFPDKKHFVKTDLIWLSLMCSLWVSGFVFEFLYFKKKLILSLQK